jgi:hypothetical protein
MNKLIKITILPALCLLSMGAQAGIVSTDWKLTNDGLATLDDDGLATLDDVSGKEWLKLTQTDGMSVASVVSQLDTTFAGWRLPTDEEVREYANSVFQSNNLNAPISGTDYLSYNQVGNTNGVVTDFGQT